ncbi:8-oxo-dGTP phosphohydrolase [Aureococcus anophagefferens]|uniref:8-oxo-dGTP phosphohydrolase n=1 Tax=Aureococcus anophagefferens TaxID=44056 RepID=A0ABR1G4T8_AURAN
MGGASAQVTQIRDSRRPSRAATPSTSRSGSSPSTSTRTPTWATASSRPGRPVRAPRRARARRPRVKDPCLNAGFEKEAAEPRIDVYDGPSAVDLRGVAGDHAECARAVEKSLFSRDDPCGFESCSFNGIFQPPNLPKGKLLAFENFHYTAQMLGVGQPDVRMADFKRPRRTRRGRVQQQVGDHGIDWSLGAAIKEATKIAHGH